MRGRLTTHSTDSLLDKLIVLAINRGAVTSLAALFNLILVSACRTY